MSFVGKILVVIIVLLSVCFMAFAGAVYTAQTNWKKAYEAQIAATKKVQGQVAELEAATAKERNERQAEFNQIKAERDAATGKVDTTARDVVDLTAKNKQLAVEAAAAKEQNKIADEEAKARKEEALELRLVNTKLLASRDEQSALRVKLDDQVQTLTVDLDKAQRKVVTLEKEVGGLKQLFANNKLSTDVKVATRPTVAPAEPVEGKITETRPARVSGNSELVEISIGSDDGLTKGHQLDVVRGAKYLGKIRVVETWPDKAVCEVVVKNKNGIIQRGDNVTTKL
ncbi:MAG: hypothetical protein HZA46_09515 [Planctomycetales bacterium]|nr:hypothetical protein [Planctomycetales bacterium]